jgi:hypothetical protein
MRTITDEAAEAQPETVSAFWMLVLEYAKEQGVFSLMERLVHVKMKAGVYSRLQKAQTVLTSLVMGCKHPQAINEVLSDERAAANYRWMSRFPDQSQINRYLTRFEADNGAQLGEVQAQVLERQSPARRAVGQIVVEIDPCGLVLSGQSYEPAHKGYFPRKRGEIGYPVSAASIGAYAEAVQVYLDPGNTPCAQRLPDLLRDSERLLERDHPGVTVIRRLDGGYDSATNRQHLATLPGYFLLKGGDSRTATRLARAVPLHQWLPVAEALHGVELACEGSVARLLDEFWLPEGRTEYALLYTHLPVDQFGLQAAFECYNERTSIEAFFAASRHVFNIQSMRSRQFQAIFAFLRFVFLTHHLIHWAKQARLLGSELVQATTRTLVTQLARVRATVAWDGRWHLAILPSSRWATLLLQALSRPPCPVQLELPFARLHKT